jgi:hypothetical protein
MGNRQWIIRRSKFAQQAMAVRQFRALPTKPDILMINVALEIAPV